MASTPADDNPFAPPAASIGDRAAEPGLDPEADAELIRRHYLSHEASIRSLGLLSSFVGAFGVLFALGGALAAIGAPANAAMPPGSSVELMRIIMWIGVAVWAVLAVFGFAMGYGLRNLQVWSRWMGVVLLIISCLYCLFLGLFLMLVSRGAEVAPLLIGVAGGLAVQAYVFYLLVAPKAGVVFSEEYRLVILRTPEIRTRTSVAVKLVLGFLMGLIVLGLLVMIVGLFR